jgi:hypothetical protein
VHAEAAVAPGKHLAGKRMSERYPPDQKSQHCAAQPLREQRLRNRRQRHEASGRLEHAVGDQRMDVGIEVDQVAEGLHEEGELRPGMRAGGAVSLGERARDDAAELAKKSIGSA